MKKLTQKALNIITSELPTPRKPPKYSYEEVFDAIFYVLETGCQWRKLPRQYGHWHTIYMRFRRWADNGMLFRILRKMEHEGILKVRITFLDSTTVRAHQSASGAPKKRGSKP